MGVRALSPAMLGDMEQRVRGAWWRGSPFPRPLGEALLTARLQGQDIPRAVAWELQRARGPRTLCAAQWGWAHHTEIRTGC